MNLCGFKHARKQKFIKCKSCAQHVDGYDEQKNVWIEIDEKGHFNSNGTLKKQDLKRQREIIKLPDCEFIRLKI